MDTVLEVNSTAMADYGFSIDIKNVSATDVDVYVRRAYHEMDCAYDSGYFCWDYCYGSDIDSSIGYINIQPGVVKGDFSGHVYSPTTGSSCLDSTRYVFYNGKDNSDSLSVWVTISAGPTVGTIELSVAESKVYPNPAVNVLTYRNPKGRRYLNLFNTLGEEVKRAYLFGARPECRFCSRILPTAFTFTALMELPLKGWSLITRFYKKRNCRAAVTRLFHFRRTKDCFQTLSLD